MTDAEIRVAELAEYCETQAGLLLGDAQTMRESLDDTLTEMETAVETVQADLDDPTAAPDAEAAIADLEEKQAVAEANRARMEAYQSLAEAYADLAETLQTEVEDGQEALDRVVRFEADRDAPAYFDERETLLEAALGDAEDES
jgi:Skp family chaperone for outer membrane proteins